jgi:hypothetical protein
MTDLSHLPLPLDWPAAGARPSAPLPKTRHEGFHWPAPPAGGFPPPGEQTQPEACAVEGLNGKVANGRLMLFSPEEQVASVQVPPSRTTLPLRFSQFRSLTLTGPLRPAGAPEAALAAPPRSRYRIELHGSTTPLVGETLGHVETPFGVFLFPPHGDAGAVLRLFVPREAIAAQDIGARVGELLVEGRAATARMSNRRPRRSARCAAASWATSCWRARPSRPSSCWPPSSSRAACRWCASARR